MLVVIILGVFILIYRDIIIVLISIKIIMKLISFLYLSVWGSKDCEYYG